MTSREAKIVGIVRLYAQQKGYCACGCKRELWHGFVVDHILPRAAGGTDEWRNKQLLAPICNSEKSCMDPMAWMRSRGRLL
jgi:RNA-directed DNA polymerase